MKRKQKNQPSIQNFFVKKSSQATTVDKTPENILMPETNDVLVPMDEQTPVTETEDSEILPPNGSNNGDYIFHYYVCIIYYY